MAAGPYATRCSTGGLGVPGELAAPAEGPVSSDALPMGYPYEKDVCIGLT